MRQVETYPSSVLSIIPPWEMLCHIPENDQFSDEFICKIGKLKNREKDTLLTKLARIFVTNFLKDPAYRKFLDSSWSEIIDVLTDQTVQNLMLRSRNNIDSACLKSVLKVNCKGLMRPYGQLPCTQLTSLQRAEMAKKYCGFHEPILLVGDDDLVSLALAAQGFSNVTVVDIDEKIIKKLKELSGKQNYKIRLFRHNLKDPPPNEIRGDYQLVFLDPLYSIEGLRLFFNGARHIAGTRSGTFYFLSIHLLSLFKKGFSQLNGLFHELNLEPKAFYRGFNYYPVPGHVKGLLFLLNLFVFRSWVFCCSKGSFDFFISDALLLQQK